MPNITGTTVVEGRAEAELAGKHDGGAAAAERAAAEGELGEAGRAAQRRGQRRGGRGAADGRQPDHARCQRLTAALLASAHIFAQLLVC